MTQYETIIGYASFQFNYTYPVQKSTDYESILETMISSIKFIDSPSDNTVDSNAIVSDNSEDKDNNEGSSSIQNSMIEDDADEKTLQYLKTPKGVLLKQTADSFVKAYFSGDENVIDQYLTADADYDGNKVYQIDGVTINVYDKMAHLLAKWYSAPDETAEVQYEYEVEEEASYTYMDVRLEYSDGKWLVTGFYFEK